MATALLNPPAEAPSPPVDDTDREPLDQSHYDSIREATARRRPVLNAARTAFLSAVTILVIGGAAMLMAMLSLSVLTYALAAVVFVVGLMELRGARMMRRAEAPAAAFLARNQMIFLGLILLYCAWQIVHFSMAGVEGSLLSPEVQRQLSQLGEMRELVDEQLQFWGALVTYGFYGLLAVLSILFQGGLALYYFTRKAHIERYNRNTPPWVQKVVAQVVH